jgi:archaellum component FlaD/FlaE
MTMPGRINPREYDLGELRDAVQETPRRAAEDGPDEDRRFSTGDGRVVPVESATDVASEEGQQSVERTVDRRRSRGGDVTASATATAETDANADGDADDVESYLRARHRPQREERDRPRKRGDEDNDRSRLRGQTAPDPDTFLAELSGSEVSRPYLDRLPDAYSAQLEVFEWLDGLLSTAGHDGTISALEYYESIGWLSEESREELEEVAAGLSVPDAAGRSLGIEDHRESLLYVARLAHR